MFGVIVDRINKMTMGQDRLTCNSIRVRFFNAHNLAQIIVIFKVFGAFEHFLRNISSILFFLQAALPRYKIHTAVTLG